jgi:hypothetical protein
VWLGLPEIFFGFFGILSGSLVLCLPETRGITLPDTMVEANALGRQQTQVVDPDKSSVDEDLEAL